MKPIYYIKAAVMGAAVLAAASCTYDPYDTDIDPTVETMTLKCENPMVEIDENNLNAPALTFTWTGAIISTLPSLGKSLIYSWLPY